MPPREFQHLEKIFASALQRVDPRQMILDQLRLDGSALHIAADGRQVEIELDDYDQLLVLGAGKATARMAQAVEELFGGRITRGLISVKYGHTAPLQRIETIEAGHPVPDDNSLLAARRMLELARQADARTLVLNLISGGGSALLALPSDEGSRIFFADKQQTTRELLACGATINEINTLRKHLSAIKGGRLARAAFPARCVSLILSDVVGDRLDAIASGPTVGDATTFEDCLTIVEKYQLAERLPAGVLALLRQGAEGTVAETPKPDDPLFARVDNLVIGSNLASLRAAEETARQLGYRTLVLTAQATGEAREWAKVLVGIGKDLRRHGLLLEPPACIIAGGETTVTLRGTGKGGRNQEIALAALADMERDPEACAGIYLLAASTDGNDGPTDAAGAFAGVELLPLARQEGLSVEAFLRDNDSYHFFERLGFLHKTGPTNTNVCDLQILLVPERG